MLFSRWLVSRMHFEGEVFLRIRVYIAMFLASLCVLTTGCSSSTTPHSSAGHFRIVTSFYPMYVAALNVTKDIDGVEVVNMTKPQTGCLHDYQLSTEDMKKLEQADAFVINGGGMESFLDKVMQRQKGLKLVDASAGIHLLNDEDGPNPHVWVSVTNAILQVKNISEQLAQLDPEHADAYQHNAEAYIARLEKLRLDMHTAIDPLPHRDIVTFHEAFPYFADEFHLNIIQVIEREPGTEPSPKEIEETVALVKKLPVRVLFTEPQYPKGAAQTIARESDAQIYSLDPVVTGDANENAADAYIDAMYKNMAVLQQALQ